MIEDSELLRRYAERRDETAFTTLVQRHVNLVFAAALRQAGTKPVTALPLYGRLWKPYLLLCALLFVPVLIRAADDVEITVELDSTWQSPTTTSRHIKTATCIVGTNGWFISGEFLRNAKVDYWLVGMNVIERRTITSSMYLERAQDFISEKILGQKPRSLRAGTYPRAGETFTTIHPSPLGQPVFHGVEGVVWLAFCSEDYLKQPGRQIPMPIGPSSHAFGYSDKTIRLQNDAGLPKRVELFATNGMSVCKYEVLETTNYLGRIFPVQFRVLQQGQPADGTAISDSKSELHGRVTSVRTGRMPKFPDEVRKKLLP